MVMFFANITLMGVLIGDPSRLKSTQKRELLSIANLKILAVLTPASGVQGVLIVEPGAQVFIRF